MKVGGIGEPLDNVFFITKRQYSQILSTIPARGKVRQHADPDMSGMGNEKDYGLDARAWFRGYAVHCLR
jgi:hypothetical protein